MGLNRSHFKTLWAFVLVFVLSSHSLAQVENKYLGYRSLDEMVAAAQSGQLNPREMLEAIEILQKALEFENLKGNIQMGAAVAGLASAFYFSVAARYYQGKAQAYAMNNEDLPLWMQREMKQIAGELTVLQRRNMDKLVKIGFPAAVAGSIVLMLPNDRQRLQADLEQIRLSLSSSEILSDTLERSKKF